MNEIDPKDLLVEALSDQIQELNIALLCEEAEKLALSKLLDAYRENKLLMATQNKELEEEVDRLRAPRLA